MCSIYKKTLAIGTFAATLGIFGAAGTANAETIVGLADVGTTQQLLSFDSATPDILMGSVDISGLDEGETLLGIDYRPFNGVLYGLGSNNAFYTIDPMSGVVTQVGDGFDTPIDGSFFGIDFNPQVDLARIESDTDINYVIDADTGEVVAVATPPFYPAGDPNAGTDPNVVDLAYTNSVFGQLADSTQLYGIDTELDILVTQANSAGTLGTVGSLGVNVIDITGFDISGDTGVAYVGAITRGQTQSDLFIVDLATGALPRVGDIGPGQGRVIAGLTVAPGDTPIIPTPAAPLLAWPCWASPALRRRRA